MGRVARRERRGAASGRSGRPARAGGGRRRARVAGRQARPRRRRPGEGRQRQPCVRAGSEAAPSPPGPRRRRRRRGRRGGSPEGPLATRSTPCVPRAGAGGKAPLRQGEPVEDPLGHDRPGRRRAETPHPKHRLGAGQRLELGRPVGVYGPPDEPTGETAGDVWHDDHPGEALRAPLHEQPCSPGCASRRSRRTPGPAAARCPAHSRGPGGLPRTGRRPARPGTPRRRGCAGADRRRNAPPPSARRGL